MTDLDVRVEYIDETWAAENAQLIAVNFYLPKTFTVIAEFEEFRVTIKVDVDDEGPHPHEIQVLSKGEGEVTGEALRRIPVATIVHHGVRKALFIVDFDGGTTFDAYADIQIAADSVRRDWPNGDLDSFLETVGWAYRLAEAVGDGPTALVAQLMKVSRATAGRMVAEARKRGAIPILKEWHESQLTKISHDEYLAAMRLKSQAHSDKELTD